MRFCAATALWFGVASSVVAAGPDDQAFGVGGGEIIGAGLGIGVVAIERALPGERLVEIVLLPGRFVERERGADHGGEVGREAGKLELAFAPGMAEPVAAGHGARDKVESARGHVEP